ncbi:MAG: histidinol-phosphate transaminase [Sedimenticolaceae bacterium]|nr:histidinol-phosphate transaminase [Sedimenticolaceae bacterium]
MINDLINRWIRPEVQAISAYHVADASGLIKLDAMENPFTWPDELRDDWARLIRDTDVNRYPDPQAQELTTRLRDCMQIPENAGILLGNGSDEIIQMLALALGGTDRTVLSVEPSFVMYKMIAAFSGLHYIGVPLTADDFALDEAAMLAAIEEHEPALLFLAYPNNPTGNLFDAAVIERIIHAAPGLVIIDEAYAPFTDASFMSRIGEFDNMVVMRTVSKMGLAGLRLGLLAGPPEWIEQIDKTRLPYNINVLTQLSADFALRHKAVFDAQTESIRSMRGELMAAFGAMPGITPSPSDANFILLRAPEGSAGAIFDSLRRQGVLIKNLDGGHPMLADCLRVTVGTAEENSALLAAFGKALDESL